jgi:hypothetical protein
VAEPALGGDGNGTDELDRERAGLHRLRISRSLLKLAPNLERRLPAILRVAEVVLGIATIGLVGYLLANQIDPSLFHPDQPAVRVAAVRVLPPPRIIPVMTDRTVKISAGEHLDTTFVVRDPRPCTLTGRVNGVRGGSRDVEVYLLDQTGYDDWHNGVQPKPLYSGGRRPSVSLHVRLPGPGRYYFLVSNRYSIFTDKLVSIRDVRATCSTPEPAPAP